MKNPVIDVSVVSDVLDFKFKSTIYLLRPGSMFSGNCQLEANVILTRHIISLTIDSMTQTTAKSKGLSSCVFSQGVYSAVYMTGGIRWSLHDLT